MPWRMEIINRFIQEYHLASEVFQYSFIGAFVVMTLVCGFIFFKKFRFYWAIPMMLIIWGIVVALGFTIAGAQRDNLAKLGSTAVIKAGNVYWEEPDGTETYYELMDYAINQFELAFYPAQQADTHLQLSDHYLQRHNYAMALENIDKVIVLTDLAPSKSVQAKMVRTTALSKKYEILVAQNDLETARPLAERILSDAREHEFYFFVMDYYMEMADYAASDGNTDEARAIYTRATSYIEENANIEIANPPVPTEEDPNPKLTNFSDDDDKKIKAVIVKLLLKHGTFEAINGDTETASVLFNLAKPYATEKETIDVVIAERRLDDGSSVDRLSMLAEADYTHDLVDQYVDLAMIEYDSGEFQNSKHVFDAILARLKFQFDEEQEAYELSVADKNPAVYRKQQWVAAAQHMIDIYNQMTPLADLPGLDVMQNNANSKRFLDYPDIAPYLIMPIETAMSQ